MQFSSFLRTVLKLDAASCLAMAAALVPGAALLQDVLGLPAALLTGAGLALVPTGLLMLWLGTRERGSAALVQLVVAGNVGWSVASFAVLALVRDVTPLGAVVLAGQALAVILFAVLEWRGLQQSTARSAT